MSKKIFANMAYYLRKYHDAVIPQVGKPKWNADWIIVLIMNSSSANYAPSEHEGFGQYDQYAILSYGPYAIPSKVMLCYRYLKVCEMKSLLGYCVNKLLWL